MRTECHLVAFSSFGGVRNSCIGNYLACRDMSIILPWMAWYVGMQLDPDSSIGAGPAQGRRGGRGKTSFGRRIGSSACKIRCMVPVQARVGGLRHHNYGTTFYDDMEKVGAYMTFLPCVAILGFHN